jgi:hypothetical protein
VGPLRPESDAFMRRLFSDEKNTRYLPFHTRPKTGGWTLQEVAARREAQVGAGTGCERPILQSMVVRHGLQNS